MVTGAGGSIGSELVRQIIRNRPRRLVLFERGESQLYEIGVEAETLVDSSYPKTHGDQGRPLHSMARGGDVFLLDMGEPVKIDELARSMIRLMGREVRDETHPYGDITIEYIGPRDGEKLYEELLLGEGVVATEHPRILRSQEPFLPRVELDALLADLQAAMEDGSKVAIQAVLMRAVESYCPARRPGPEPVPPREAA